MKSVSLPSGAELKVNPAPFVDAKNLYQALLRELKTIQIDSKMEIANLYKELFCAGFSSPEIEIFLWKCMERCAYNDGRGSGDRRIDKDTFESLEARQDYMKVCMEVARANVDPFMKSLFAEYQLATEMIEKNQK